MEFVPKMSGVAVSDFDIKLVFNERIITVDEAKNLKSIKAFNFIMENYEWLDNNGEKVTILNFDDMYKISIMENYPNYAEELKNYFGDNWANYYIRFNH